MTHIFWLEDFLNISFFVLFIYLFVGHANCAQRLLLDLCSESTPRSVWGPYVVPRIKLDLEREIDGLVIGVVLELWA